MTKDADRDGKPVFAKPCPARPQEWTDSRLMPQLLLPLCHLWFRVLWASPWKIDVAGCDAYAEVTVDIGSHLFDFPCLCRLLHAVFVEERSVES